MVAGCVAEDVVAGLLPPKSPPEAPDGCEDALPNRLDPTGLEESIGGAPAGVVEARENAGFAGVAADVVAAGVVLFPNNELPVLANMPEAGAAEVVGVG